MLWIQITYMCIILTLSTCQTGESQLQKNIPLTVKELDTAYTSLSQERIILYQNTIKGRELYGEGTIENIHDPGSKLRYRIQLDPVDMTRFPSIFLEVDHKPDNWESYKEKRVIFTGIIFNFGPQGSPILQDVDIKRKK